MIYSMVMTRNGHIFFHEVGNTVGDVLTLASERINSLGFLHTTTTCNNVEKYLDNNSHEFKYSITSK